MKTIPLTRSKEVIVDDEDFVPLLRWKWHFDGRYARRGNYPDRNGVLMHRQILKISNDELSCDHKNGNGLDNRKVNLRICTHDQNTKNRRISRNNSSGFKGVCWSEKGNAWGASIGINNKRLHLGYYKTKEEAAKAYNEAAKKLHGEFANLNDV